MILSRQFRSTHWKILQPTVYKDSCPASNLIFSTCIQLSAPLSTVPLSTVILVPANNDNEMYISTSRWRGVVLLTSLTSLVVPLAAIVTAQLGSRVVAVAAPSLFDLIFHELYLYTGNYDRVIQSCQCMDPIARPLSVVCCQHCVEVRCGTPTETKWMENYKTALVAR